MNRDKLYLVGDYVRYEGDMSILAEPLSSPDIGRIEEFRDFFDKERIYLYLLNKKQHIWCDYDKIRPIYTSKKILESIGFNETENNNRKKYSLHNICVSECAINIFDKRHLIFSGFCATDFTNGIPNLEKYICDNEFDLKIFYEDYPYVQNVNDLLLYLKNNEIEVDSEKAVCS
ncbi:hypothetical protein P1X15_21470 [Runella sp. MFBS21]|uniref:hypothetical protein n=1 Tax=Runella sp. MFBS21 TaxID=3034018 RepID=UPI0023F9CA8A|nr:hypothetical protein [Runella sp. MFBS21]MDF7820204.1 hypothetical protein [Runella sp. MFBS21]